jgi:transglutaminase-like putative cysteine protease
MRASLLPIIVSSVLAAETPELPKPVFLHVFPMSVDNRIPADSIELTVSWDEIGYGELGARGAAKKGGDGRVRVRVEDYPRSFDPVIGKHLECTFLIDCDESPVRQAAVRAARELGSEPDMPALTAWVRGYITQKTHTRGFDIASVVSRRREGDCTEHAVLLAALARLRKIPARVVLGLVLIDVEKQGPLALGHAWVEFHDKKNWRVADAALPLEEVKKAANGARYRVRYVPVSVVSREDAGYNAGLIDLPHVLIRGVSTASPAWRETAGGTSNKKANGSKGRASKGSPKNRR